MDIIESEVVFKRVDCRCTLCNTGYLRPTGKVFYTLPAQYEHVCNNGACGCIETFKNTYPYMSGQDNTVGNKE
jgi:hypothetical protein